MGPSAGLNPAPQPFDSGPEVVERPVVEDHLVGGRAALLAAGLRGNPLPRGVGGHAALRDETLDLGRRRRIDHDDEVEVALLTGLDEKRDVVHDDLVGARLRLEACGLRAYQRVDDLFQPYAPPRVAEHHSAEPRPIETAGAVDHVGPERLDDLAQSLGAGLDHSPRELVGVDHQRTLCLEHPADCRLAGGDAAGQTDTDTARCTVRHLLISDPGVHHGHMAVFVVAMCALVVFNMIVLVPLVRSDGLSIRVSSGLDRRYVPSTLPDHPYATGPLPAPGEPQLR